MLLKQPVSHHGHIERLLFTLSAGLVVLAVACRLASLAVPIFDWDEYAFGLSGRSLLTGHLPTAEIFDNKPIGLIDMFALAEAVFGQTWVALRITGFCAALVTAWLIRRSVARAGASRGAALTASALFLSVTLYENGWASMSELIACPFIAIANDLALRAGPRKRSQYVVLGCIAGTAFQVTYLTLPVFGLLGLAMLAGETPQVSRRNALNALAASIGFALMVTLLWLPYILASALPAYLREQAIYGAHYRVPPPPPREYAYLVGKMMWPIAIPLLVAALARGRGVTVRMAGVVAAVVGGVVATLASNRLYTHYFIIVLPSAAVLVALLTIRASRLRTTIILAVSTAVAAVILAVSVHHLRDRLTGAPAKAAPPVVIAGMGETDFDLRVSRLVEALSRPQDPIFVFDESHVIYYLAQRPAALRYVFLTHYIAESPGARVILPAPALLEKVIERHPRLIVIGHLVPVAINADARVAQHGYRPCGALADRDRHLEIYCRT